MSKHTLKYYLRLYLKLMSQSMKNKLSYRADFVITNIGTLFINMLDILSFWIIFHNFPSIGQWNYREIIFFYSFMILVRTPCAAFFQNNWNLRYYVYSGDFIKYCFRPVNLFFYYVSEEFEPKSLSGGAVGVGLMVYVWISLKIPVTFANICKLLLGWLTGSLVLIAIMVMATATCFYILNSGYILLMTNKLLDYSKYPATIFNTLFRIIFCTILPISFVVYYPSLLVLNSGNISILTMLSPVVALLFLYISYKFWMKGAMAYGGTGS